MATIKDVILIYLEDSPVSFARVESILPDAKKDWYQIKLLMLQIPMQTVTWILKDAYINGEQFHMNGKKMKLEVVECPNEDPSLSFPGDTREKKPPLQETKEKNTGQIISFSDLKNRQKDHGQDRE
ncbi:MAG: hypothetical protein KKF12_20370 [Proteobacteria bacterium]|nr:hypothetical protein [Desulfobacula sp.]MBU3953015.1 hypothetical protein [Pseudomonadota bacterium]MBU4133182.1 hypothetical protein [Pseudomonadota bacterium]